MYAQQPLTLEACRDLAIHNNKELRIAAEKTKIAEYEKKAAFTKYFPEVSATGVYMWNEKDLQLVDPTSLGAIGQLVPNLGELFHLDIQNIWVGGVTLMQPVFMGGKIVNYNQITSYARELAESMHDTKLQEIIYQTDQSYWQVISLVNKQKLADAYVQLLQKMDRDVDEMISEGVATRADGLSVKVKLNEAEMVKNKVENGLALSRMLLSQLCGLSLDAPLSLADEHIEIELVTVNDIPANVNEAFLNRPELRSLDLATKIYKKKENIELANLLPTVALSASYLTTNPSANNDFKNEFNGMFHVGLLASVPLSGWWEGTHKRNSARAETIIRKLEFEDTREKIELQVNQSLYQVNEAHKRLAASTRNMESAEENLRHANIGFEEGIIPALNLMEAQTAWLSAHSELIDAQIEVKLTKVYLTKALGKLTLGEPK
ncbi:alkaline protease [Bacteroidia bacterium]|nr:alkaline protease [Bacteroidia bacterium]